MVERYNFGRQHKNTLYQNTLDHDFEMINEVNRWQGLVR